MKRGLDFVNEWRSGDGFVILLAIDCVIFLMNIADEDTHACRFRSHFCVLYWCWLLVGDEEQLREGIEEGW